MLAYVVAGRKSPDDHWGIITTFEKDPKYREEVDQRALEQARRSMHAWSDYLQEFQLVVGETDTNQCQKNRTLADMRIMF